MRQLGEIVRIIHAEGTSDESVVEAVAHIQPKKGFFEVDAPVYEGDIVEVHEPRQGRDGRERRLVRDVAVLSNAPRGSSHHV
jgi:hypothetical protein